MITAPHAKRRLAVLARVLFARSQRCAALVDVSRAHRFRRSTNLYARYATKVFGVDGAR